MTKKNNKEIKSYTIIRDSREKVNYWKFNKTEHCNGTVDDTLKTGDYSLKSLTDVFSIERKASTGELAGNLTTKQFENELTRADKLDHFFLILEFSLSDVLNFPYGSGIPKKFWPRLKMSSGYLLKRLIEIQTNHKVQVIFAGSNENAKQIAKAIFKRMAELYPDKVE